MFLKKLKPHQKLSSRAQRSTRQLCASALAAAVLLCTSLAQAELINKFKTKSVNADGWLKLEIHEVESSGPQCDLVLSRLLYLEELNVLDLQLQEQTNCPLDSMGPRKAELHWKLPFSVTNEGLHLRINGQPYGFDLHPITKKAGSR